VFQDLDGDGSWDEGEPPFSGRVVVTRPDGSVVRADATMRGRYRVPVQESGLHQVRYEAPRLDCVCDVILTTPNPLEVLIVPDEHGQPQDYLEASFGVQVVPRDGDRAPIVLTDHSPEQIQQDPYRLSDIALRGDVLSMRVGFSGCSPDQPFTLFMSGGFMESNPVQARLVLGHVARGSECDAAWERTLHFDLRPLREAYEHAYGGGGPGTVRLRFTDLQGNEHEFRYVWEPPIGESLLRNGSPR
jgi:hypothetical protein